MKAEKKKKCADTLAVAVPLMPDPSAYEQMRARWFFFVLRQHRLETLEYCDPVNVFGINALTYYIRFVLLAKLAGFFAVVIFRTSGCYSREVFFKQNPSAEKTHVVGFCQFLLSYRLFFVT